MMMCVYLFMCNVEFECCYSQIQIWDLVFSLDGINAILIVTNFFKKSLCYLP